MACWGEDGMHGIIIISNWSDVLLGEIRSRQVQFRNALQQQFRLQICVSCVAWAFFVESIKDTQHRIPDPLCFVPRSHWHWRCFGWFQKKITDDLFLVCSPCVWHWSSTFAPRWCFVATEFPWSANACIANLRQSVGVSASNTSSVDVPCQSIGKERCTNTHCHLPGWCEHKASTSSTNDMCCACSIRCCMSSSSDLKNIPRDLPGVAEEQTAVYRRRTCHVNE